MSLREELGSKRICCHCIGEAYLSAIVEGEGNEAECSCRNDLAPCIDVESLSERVNVAFDQHFSRTSDQPDDFESALLRDKELNYDWYRSGQPAVDAIADMVGLPEEAAQDVQAILNKLHNDFDAATMGEERWRITQEGDAPFGIAGIYRRWRNPAGGELLTFTMLTVNADQHPFYRRFHKACDETRMPVFLDREEYGPWLTATLAGAPAFFRMHPGPFLGAPAPLARAPTIAKDPLSKDEIVPAVLSKGQWRHRPRRIKATLSSRISRGS